MSRFDLAGRTALVTGSSGGIGLGLAFGLAEAGASVILNGRNAEKLNEVVETYAPDGVMFENSVFDVTDERAVEKAFAEFDRNGVNIDILINNAGIQLRKPLLELELTEWTSVIDTNLTSAFIVSRAAARRMVARRQGKIINITSLTGEITRKNVGPYTAAKGGLKMLTKAMAAEWAGSGVQVNAIGPGNIATEMTGILRENPTFNTWVETRTPAGRWGIPDDLVGAAVYLSSPGSDFVNGQTIYVDGGLLSVM